MQTIITNKQGLNGVVNSIDKALNEWECEQKMNYLRLKINNMIPLNTNETFVNNTGKDIYYKVEYINAMGENQVALETLKPTQSLTKTNAVNKVYILLN
jgi:hypothetical protein